MLGAAGFLYPAQTTPAPDQPGASFLPPTPTNQLQVKPVTNIPMGSETTQYDTGPHQLSIGTGPYSDNSLGGGGGSDQVSEIANFTAQLESGGGHALYAGGPPKGMVDTTYGQFGPFQSQYGKGAQGVDNYVAQILKANPNATLGDYYSGYVLDTGDPSKLPGADALKDRYPAAYNNLQKQMAARGYSLNTPLSSLTGASGNRQIVGYSDDGYPVYANVPTPKTDPNALKPGTQDTGTTYDPQAAQDRYDAQQAQNKKQMEAMMALAAIKGFALHPVPYNPAAILELSRSHLYGPAETHMTGLPNMAGSAIPKLQLSQDVTAISPRRVPGALGQKGPPQ